MGRDLGDAEHHEDLSERVLAWVAQARGHLAVGVTWFNSSVWSRYFINGWRSKVPKQMRKGSGQSKMAGPARQHAGKMLSGISLSSLSPKQVRCSEMSPCFAIFSFYMKTMVFMSQKATHIWFKSLVGIVQWKAELTHSICVMVYLAFSAAEYLWS